MIIFIKQAKLINTIRSTEWLLLKGRIKYVIILITTY